MLNALTPVFNAERLGGFIVGFSLDYINQGSDAVHLATPRTQLRPEFFRQLRRIDQHFEGLLFRGVPGKNLDCHFGKGKDVFTASLGLNMLRDFADDRAPDLNRLPGLRPARWNLSKRAA